MSLFERRPLLTPAQQDVGLAVVLALVTVAATVSGQTTGADKAGAVGLALGETLPLAVRRRYPASVALIVAAASAGSAFVHSFVPFGIIVALYTVAVTYELQRALIVGVACLAPITVALLYNENWSVVVLPRVLLLAAAWVIGDNIRTRRRYLRAVEDKATRLEREREEHARRVAAEEQARIAREVHDLVGHSLTVIAVQAAAAGHVFDLQPGRARRALVNIEATAGRALDELRRVLGVESGADTRTPQPGLERLDELCQQLRLAGLSVDLVIRGEPRPLAATVEISAYRIVQEALTNTLRHAGATQVTVTVEFAPSALRIDVADDGSQSEGHESHDGDDDGLGRGLIGMRARAAVFGGTVDAGPRQEGGFAVHAELPFEEGER